MRSAKGRGGDWVMIIEHLLPNVLRGWVRCVCTGTRGAATVQNCRAPVLTMLYDSVIPESASACSGESILIPAKSFQCISCPGVDQPPKAPDLQTSSVLS